MNKDQIHPMQFKTLLGSLPVGCEFIKAQVVGPTSSNVTFSRPGGQEVTIPFEKTRATSCLGDYPLAVEVVDGEPMDDVIQRFSKLYNFPILKDVDYTPADVAKVGELSKVVILDTSLFFTGEFVIELVSPAPKARGVEEVDLTEFKKALPK